VYKGLSRDYTDAKQHAEMTSVESAYTSNFTQ